MKLESVIMGMESLIGSCGETCEVSIVHVNSVNEIQKEIFKGIVKEMVAKWRANEPFGAGLAKDWYVVGYNYVAYTIADEVLPVFTRPIEIRVI